MSRIGSKPIPLPQGVTLDRVEGGVRVKGPKGTLSEPLPAEIGLEVREGAVVFGRPDESRPNRALPPRRSIVPFAGRRARC